MDITLAGWLVVFDGSALEIELVTVVALVGSEVQH